MTTSENTTWDSRSQAYDCVVEAADNVAAMRDRLAELLDERDDAIRSALTVGVDYANLMTATSLSRAALDNIRRGARRR